VVATEEERLGLVKGDSSNLLPIASHISEEREEQTVYVDDQNWVIPRTQSPGYSPIRAAPPPRRVDTEDVDPLDDKEFEKDGRPSAFR
jgi:hypothetical protein